MMHKVLITLFIFSFSSNASFNNQIETCLITKYLISKSFLGAPTLHLLEHQVEIGNDQSIDHGYSIDVLLDENYNMQLKIFENESVIFESVKNQMQFLFNSFYSGSITYVNEWVSTQAEQNGQTVEKFLYSLESVPSEILLAKLKLNCSIR